MRWSDDEDSIIEAFASLGVRGVQQALMQDGYDRTQGAIKMRASRLGLSLIAYQVCPKCGRRRKKLHRSGFCDLCAKRDLITAQAVRNRELRAEVMREKDEELIKAKRQYNAIRGRNLRLQRKLKK